MPGPVLRQISELLAHHVVRIPHIILGLARVVRLCAQGHLCPGNVCSWRYTVSLNCLQDVNPACGVVSPPWEVWLCWHSLDFSVSLAYWWASPETSRMLMHGADTCMSSSQEGRIYNLDSALHWCSHMASGLQLVMEQARSVRDHSWDCRCVLILHVKMILSSSFIEKYKG